jgi:hypothetical protein
MLFMALTSPSPICPVSKGNGRMLVTWVERMHRTLDAASGV